MTLVQASDWFAFSLIFIDANNKKQQTEPQILSNRVYPTIFAPM